MREAVWPAHRETAMETAVFARVAYGAGVGSNAVATGASTRSVVVTANTKGSPTHTNANAAADVMRAMRTALGAGARPSTSSDEASRTCSYFCEVRLRMVDHV